MKKLTPEVEDAVDRICALGCEVVTSYIEALQKNEPRAEYRLLSDTQRASLLRELQSIMAVYQIK